MTPAELADLAARVREFVVEDIVPLETQVANGANPPAEVLARLRARARDVDVWSLGRPAALGGRGLTAYERCILVEEMARTPLTGGWLGAGVFGEVGPNLLEIAGTGEQLERYVAPVVDSEGGCFFAMSEPGAGSDPSAMLTRARAVDGGWVLNGTKGLIGYAGTATYGFVFAVTKGEGAMPEVSCFLVDTDAEGFVHRDEVISYSGIPVGYVDLVDCFVPATALVGDVGEGLRLGQAWLGQMRTVYYGGAMLGYAGRALDMARAHAQGRQTFGEPLAERQHVQFAIADSAMELRQAELLVHDTARAIDEGRLDRVQVAMTKVVATEMAARVVDRAMQIHGGLGLTPMLPLEQMQRMARTFRVTEGPNEVHRWYIGRQLLRSDPG